MKLIVAAALAATLLCNAAAASDKLSKTPVAGERAFQHCYSCHSIDPREVNLPAPNLYGIIGRSIASQPGFQYSEALQQLARMHKVWTKTLLDQFMRDPAALAPGTVMEAPPGMDKLDVRQAILDYLGRNGPDAQSDEGAPPTR